MPAAALHSDKPIAWPKLSGLGLFALVLITLGLCRIAGTTPGAWHRNDFAHYYLSARLALNGDSPYTTSLEPLCQELGFEYDERIVAGTNPPPLNLLVGGVAWLPPAPAYVGWTLLQTACLAGLLAMLMRQTSCAPGESWQWLAVGVVLCSTAVWSHFHYSQVQLLVAFLISSAYFLRLKRRGSAAIVCIAIATALKLYPAVLLPWFVLSGENRWRGVRQRALLAVGLGLAIFILSGPRNWFDFATHGLSTIQSSVAVSTSNYSLQSTASLLTGAVVGRPAPDQTLESVLWASRLLAAAGIAGAYLAIWRWRLQDWRAIGILTIAMLLASPVLWSHYLVLMILPAWLVWSETNERRFSASGVLLTTLAALCLMSELDAPVPLGRIGLVRTALHLYPTALLLALAAALLLARPAAGVGSKRVSA